MCINILQLQIYFQNDSNNYKFDIIINHILNMN